ncbi:transporter substrate-binding domain-containing protein [Luteibacter aegosomatis]|uniref:transporter substrate-binding domain-containing protein n=1 Tax=Luteibacter aegosomatis TaxID=2911537 RepID=UPI001FF799A6|nr:transporter substrate-binding domain-containing protein [Luteibacter aegosomatis]UPG85373.1 transporter substrate-binding domain-containing protein [Luteibacter aegosomatis]
MKSLFSLFVAGFFAWASASASSLPDASKQWLLRHPVIVAATYAEGYAPFERVHDGHVDGLATEYLRRLAGDLGIGVRFRVYPDWPSAMAAAQSGEVDLLMDVAPTPERNGKLLIGAPYYESSPVIVLRRDDTRVARFDDLRGARVATQAGQAEDDVLHRYLPDAHVTNVPSVAAALRELERGTVDAVIGDPHALDTAILAAGLGDRLRIGPPAPLPFSTLSFAVAAGSGHAPLLTALDHAFAQLGTDDHARLRSAWIGDEPGRFAAELDVPLSASERAWLARLPPLRIAIDPTAAPVTLLDRDGKPDGLATDYLRDVARVLGLRFDVVSTDSWQETVRRASAGEIDLLPAASPRNEALSGRFDFTAPYTEFPVMVVTREDAVTVSSVDDLAGRRLAANLARPAVARAVEGIAASDTLAVSSVREGLDAVLDGRADAYVGDVASTEYLVRRDYPARLKVTAATGERDEIAMAVERRYAKLIPLIDRVLARMPERRAQAIANTWLRSHYTWGGSWGEIARRVGIAGVAIVALLLAVSHAYVRLRRETRRRRAIEDQLADVTRSVPAVVYRFRHHPDGRIEFTYLGGNPEPIFGVGAEVFLHDERSAFARIDPRDQGPLQAEVARAAASLTPLHAEMRVRDSEPTRWIASHALPRADGPVVEFTGYWIDISERRRQSNQLAAAKDTAEKATRAKSEFLAMMSHEIRTPMHGIVGMLDLLGDTPLSAEQRRFLDTAGHSADALMHILDDVLDFSRIEAGRLTVEATPVDIRALVDGIAGLFAGQAARKGLHLFHEVDDHVAPWSSVDGIRLRQVLVNLLSNAIKFTAEGHVSLRLERVAEREAGQHLRFTVADTGIGIAEDDARRLFTPFSQVDSSSGHVGGSGLGLAISRRLVDLMGGTIDLRSEPGRGTRVDVDLTLPRSAAGERTIATKQKQGHAFPERVLQVVVAEDHPINRELVAAQLERLGHRHHVVACGEEALELAASLPADVLLTDLRMPGLDGYGLTRALRERGSRLAIVAMTANAMEGEKERCLDAGMDGFIAKPVRIDALRLALATCVPDDEAPWDTALLTETFGHLGVLPSLVDRFAESTREDIAHIHALSHPGQVAERIHRLLGGMRVFGTSSAARLGEALEIALRGDHAREAMQRVPTFIDVVEAYLERLRRGVARLSDRRETTKDFSE